MASLEDRIIEELQRYVAGGGLEKAKKRNARFAEIVEKATSDQIFYGEQPKFIEGYVYGNATAVGKKTEDNVECTRTVSIDFRSDTLLFISSKNEADIKTCKEAAKRFSYVSHECHTLAEADSIAERNGKRFCKEDLHSLNFFSMKEFRVNSYDVEFTSAPFYCPCVPIYIKHIEENQKEEWYHIGYYEEHDQYDKIDIDVKAPITKTQKYILLGLGIAAAVILLGWLFLG